MIPSPRSQPPVFVAAGTRERPRSLPPQARGEYRRGYFAHKRRPRLPIAPLIAASAPGLSFCSQQRRTDDDDLSPTVPSARFARRPCSPQAPNSPYSRARLSGPRRTRTHRPRPGVTAWTISVETHRPHSCHITYVDGSTLRCIQRHDQGRARVRRHGHRLRRSAQPTQLWSSTLRKTTCLDSIYLRLERRTSSFFHDAIIRRPASEPSLPWGLAFLVMADAARPARQQRHAADGRRRAASGRTCGPRQRRSKIHRGLSADLGYSPRNAITGSGRAHPSWFLSTTTGFRRSSISTLGRSRPWSNPDGDGGHRTVEVTPEGYVVYENIDSYGFFDSDAALQSTFKTARNLPIVSHDETPAQHAGRQESSWTHQNAPGRASAHDRRHQDECMSESLFTADGSTHTSPSPMR